MYSHSEYRLRAALPTGYSDPSGVKVMEMGVTAFLVPLRNLSMNARHPHISGLRFGGNRGDSPSVFILILQLILQLNFIINFIYLQGEKLHKVQHMLRVEGPAGFFFSLPVYKLLSCC